MSALVNAEVEQHALGLLLHASRFEGPARAQELLAKSGLLPDQFALPLHREVFAAMEALLRQQRPATLPAVATLLAGSEAFRAAGGRLATLLEAALGEQDTALPQYAETIRSLALLRRAADFLRGVATRAQRPSTDPVALLNDLRRFADENGAAAREFRTCGEDAFRLAEKLDAVASGKREPVLPTGIEILDQEVGGFRPTLTVIGGLPGIGKSALVATILGNWAKQGIKCGLFGLEDGTEWVTERLVSREANVPLSWLDRRLDDKRAEDVVEASGRVSLWMQNVAKCAPPGRLKPADLVAQARDWVVNRGVRAVIVDHIGELHHGDNRERYDLSIAESLSQLRSLARDYGAVVVAVAHLKRATGKRPTQADFAESAYVERMARLALGVWAGDDPTGVNLTVLKHTYGPAGGTVTVRRVAAAALVASFGGSRLDEKEAA